MYEFRYFYWLLDAIMLGMVIVILGFAAHFSVNMYYAIKETIKENSE